MTYIDLRKNLGDPYIKGIGLEIGAGIRPVIHNDIIELYYFDKRSPEDFELYFGVPPPYKLINRNDLAIDFPLGVDFVTAHHVL